MTQALRRLSRQKKRAWVKAKGHNIQGKLWKRYLALEKAMKSGLAKAHGDYITNILNNNIKDNPKKFYSYIKNKKSGNTSIPTLKDNGNILSEPTDKANALNSQYASVFTKEPDGNIPSPGTTPHPNMPNIQFTTNAVEKLLANLNPSQANGPDRIPTRILKLAAKELSPVITFLFQQSYDTGEVPSDWKHAEVSAVYKKGDKTAPSNYRPISLTCVLCKCMEHILFSQITNHLDFSKVLVHFQHGFRAGHSYETQLITTVDDVARQFEKTGGYANVRFCQSF